MNYVPVSAERRGFSRFEKLFFSLTAVVAGGAFLGGGFACVHNHSMEWRAKFTANVRRDRQAVENLRGQGWRVAIVWECAVHVQRAEATAAAVHRWLAGCAPLFETMPQDGADAKLVLPLGRGDADAVRPAERRPLVEQVAEARDGSAFRGRSRPKP